MVFSLEKNPFSRFLVSAVKGVLLPKLAFRPKTGLFFILVGRGRFLPPGRDFGPGDTILGRPGPKLGGGLCRPPLLVPVTKKNIENYLGGIRIPFR